MYVVYLGNYVNDILQLLGSALSKVRQILLTRILKIILNLFHSSVLGFMRKFIIDIYILIIRRLK